jgi:hypothetical protein
MGPRVPKIVAHSYNWLTSNLGLTCSVLSRKGAPEKKVEETARPCQVAILSAAEGAVGLRDVVHALVEAPEAENVLTDVDSRLEDKVPAERHTF